jgi:hypothetical protein
MACQKQKLLSIPSTPSFPAGAGSLAEKAFYAAKTVPKFYKDSLGFPPVMLKSALFRPVTGPRTNYPAFTQVRAHGSHKIEFKGEELRQDDERLLMALLKLRSGASVDGVQEFVPRTFCRDVLGWADSSDSVAKLKASLARLQSARVHVEYADGGEGYYSFVSDFDSQRDNWSVWLSPRLVAIFDRHPTYLSMKNRLALKDGINSWLYGFIKADSSFAPFSLSDLREVAGSTYDQKNFNRQIKGALETLKGEGLLKGFALKKGKLEITK